ncbi:hypothetical protein GGI43DRAFT_298865 [Trichoderma evansii]
MRLQPTLTVNSLEPRATPTKEYTQLPPPPAESTTQAVTAQVFTYVTPPAPTNQPFAPTIPVGGSNPRLTALFQIGIALAGCIVIFVAGVLIYRFKKRRSNKRAKANQGSTSIPSNPNPPMSELPAQQMSSRQREKMPASNTAFQTAMDDDEIRPVTPRKVFVVSKNGGKPDDDSSSLVISPC